MAEKENRPLTDFIFSSEYNILEKFGAIIFYTLVTSVGWLADQFHISYQDPDSQE